jgi:hypothetical protein
VLIQVTPTSTPKIGPSLGITAPTMKAPKSVSSLGSRWYNYGDAVNCSYTGTNPGTTSVLNGNYLFPDTSINAMFGTTKGTPWIHWLGDVFDPKSAYFNNATYANVNPAIDIDKTKSYTIDSLMVAIGYTRHTASAIVDSLIVEIGMVPAATATYVFYNSGSAPDAIPANLGTDTVLFKGIQWSYTNKNLTATNKMRYAVALKVADTVGGNHFISIATPTLAAFPANSLAVSSVSFKPGYTWVANHDTLDKTKNYINFLSNQENSGTSFGTKYTKRDWNVSYVIPNDVCYNTATTSGWNGFYVPSFAYDGGTADNFPFEHHLIYYKVSCATCNMVSTNDIKQDGFAIGNTYPNPVSQGTDIVIPVTLDVRAKASIVVYDILGKQVGAVLQENNLITGSNEVKLSTRNLQPGIYSVSVSVGHAVKTIRLVVTK